MDRNGETRVLAVDPTSRGFGYAVLEGPGGLVDWGVPEGPRADNGWVLAHLEDLVHQFKPDKLIIEDMSAGSARRRPRVRALLVALQHLATKNTIETVPIARHDVKRCFSSAAATNKEQIADTLVGHFEELKISRPPIRKTWMSEDPRMAIFDAVAFAMTFFFHQDN